MNRRNIFLLFLDLVTAFLIVFFIYRIRFGFEIPASHKLTFILLITSPILLITFGLLMGNYTKKNSIDLEIAGNLFLSGLITYFIFFLALMIIRIYLKSLEFSAPVLILFSLAIPFVLLILHILAGRFASRAKHKETLLIVGYKKSDRNTLDKYLNDIMDIYNIVGTVGDELRGMPAFTEDRDIFSLIEQYDVSNILFARSVDHSLIEKLVLSGSLFTTSLLFTPELYEEFNRWGKVRPYPRLPLFELDINPIRGGNQLFKRIFDILFSIVGLVVFLPFGMIIALLILADSPGKVFFTQIRLGIYAKPFKVIKFRTMFRNAEKESGPKWTEPNDTRITKTGRILRRLSLDEIPQLMNILAGQMSLVGPRPERPFFVEKHSALKGIRMLVKPGLTGLAQINGRYELTPEEKAAFDLQFINNFSLSMYFSIIIRTVIIIIGGKGVR